ncbi:hypothetical protein [Arthrobacter sp. S2(2024)]|uniref:hypothetical protein n=1 Tax=Arthrobacter sp. S2(2024) TaxID=3111911 RepID=UPI002FC7AC2C
MTTGPAPGGVDDELFERLGTVHALQLLEDWTWTTKRGDTLRASAGDWRIHDDEASWTVKAELFAATYRHIGGDCYKRVGVVRARQVCSVETVRTLEGDATALQGDWIVTGAMGESWPVSEVDFRERYRSVKLKVGGACLSEPMNGDDAGVLEQASITGKECDELRSLPG